jgi:hypothetical protein
VYYNNFGEEKRLAVSLRDITRLYFNARRQTYTMITLADPLEPKLTKQSNVAVLRNRKKVTMQITTGDTWTSREFEVTDIADYVSALKIP